MNHQNSSVQYNDTMNLVVTGLSYLLHEKILFEPISFALNNGAGIWIKGVNGAGKSSLLRLLAGISSSKIGSLHWNTNREHIYSHIHYLGHSDGLRKGLTVIENLKLSAALLQQEIVCLQEALEALQLENVIHKPIQSLSAGQKRRAALARLFVFPRSIWILDEPITSLDTQTQQIIHTKIAAHLTAGGLCILTSHQPLPETLQQLQQIELLPC